MGRDVYVTMQEAASLLGVTSATLRSWDKKGRLKAARNPLNKYRMYRLDDVLTLHNETSLFPVTPTTAAEIGAAVHHGQSLTGPELRRLVKALHRVLRDCEGNSSIIERFDELTKVLFCKVHDEQQPLLGEQHAFSFQSAEDDRATAARVRAGFQALVKRKRALFPLRFSELRLADTTLRRMVEILAPVRISGAAEDLKGLAYEEIIRNTFEKGDNQQFFTPRHIIEFMVSMLDFSQAELVCDPACGTGGFLLYVDRHLKQKNWNGRCELLGFEIDERLAWVAGINLDVHDVSRFSIRYINGAGSLGRDVEEHFGRIDIIVTNPPFGSDLSDKDALSRLELGRGRTSRRRGVLFIERCLDLLKPGGCLGIIIDDAVLNSPSNEDTRRLILRRSHPLAVISLPETAFMPYASVKSSILFLQKADGAKSTMRPDHRTFFAEAEVVGRKPNGDPQLRVNKSTGRTELDSDLPAILRQWKAASSSDLAIPDTQLGFWSSIPAGMEAQFEHDGSRLDPAYHHPSRHEAAKALRSSPFPLASLLDICDVRNEMVVPSKDLQDEELTYIGLANIEAHTGIYTPAIVAGSSLKSTVKRFVSGDILFAKLRPELHKVCLIGDDIDEGFASAECLVLVPRIDAASKEPVMIPQLLALLLRSDLAYGQIVHQVTGIGRPRLSRTAVLNLRLPVPPIGEQRRLLELYHRSERAAQALLSESEKAAEKSRQLMAEARHQLVSDLLRNAASH